MAHKFLIVVDMQNDFIHGSLGTAEAQAMLPHGVRRVRQAREAGETIIATMDTHMPDYLDTAEGRKLPVPHCIKDTQGWRIHPEILEAMGEATILEKPTFASLALPGLIKDMAGDTKDMTVELLGLCTDICVLSNALLLKAHFPDARICVRPDCCAGVTPQKHQAALDAMSSCQIDML